eukprot:gene7646-9883_t
MSKNNDLPKRLHAIPKQTFQSLQSRVRSPLVLDERPAVARGTRGYAPLPWSDFFDKREMLDGPGDTGAFAIYEKGSGPVTVLLLHGGGHSAMSWGVFVNSLASANASCRMIAFDCRGHGETTVTPEEDLSTEQLCKDLKYICEHVLNGEPVFVVGHSMGGATAVHAIHDGYVPNPSGVAVFDVVEGTAISSLSHMNRFLNSRPTHFESLEQAIAWSLKSGQLRNRQSARVSIPAQLISCKRRDIKHNQMTTASSFLEELPQDDNQSDEHDRYLETTKSLDTQPGLQHPQIKSADDDDVYTWRVNLQASGLSNKFLLCPCLRLLVLAGVDRLDKQLTIAQMQGKFQLHVVRDSGHSIQEDCPDNVAQVVASIVNRMGALTIVTPKEPSE